MRGEEETLLVEEDQVLSYSIRLCRICHEEEIEFGGGEGKEENSTSMESPCACSGSLKFAHRDCIQRWCDEKGNTICEICLQNFEPGYTIPKKFQLGDVAVTIRDSLAVPRENYEPQRPDSTPATAEHELDRHPECTIASDGTASCCRSMAFTFTLLLLARHLISVLAISADQYALTLVTMFVLRACGIILPMYIIMRIITLSRQWQLEHQQLMHETREDAEEEQPQHIIQIHIHS